MSSTNEALKEMEKYKQKVDAIHQQFEEAEERAKAEVIELRNDIQEMEANTHELYKDYVLGTISSEAFQYEKDELNKKKQMLQDTEKKITDIDELRTEELTKLYLGNRGFQSKFNQEKNKIIKEQHEKILQAKKDYLDAVASETEIIKEYQFYDKFYGDLRVDVGDADYNYTNAVDATVLPINHFSDDGVRIDVSEGEIKSAFKKKVE